MVDGSERTRRVILLTPNFDNNSLGRTFCLWLLAKHLGFDVRVCGVKGSVIWKPLSSSEFAGDCIVPTTAAEAKSIVLEQIRQADLVIAVKPLPSSFGVAIELCELADVPLLLDIDDPDLEVRTLWLPLYERLARRLLRPRYRELLKLRELTKHYERIVSNPVLKRMYGGEIIPHVRTLSVADPIYGDSHRPVVRFVGSPRGHKGTSVLRKAVARLADRGFSLEVTAPAPEDPHEWERWLGQTSMREGAALVATADIVAIPSLVNSWSPAQLPAKLVDAMIHGRAIVASRTEPMEWALAGTGVLVDPGDIDGLASALERLESPEARRELGTRARERAIELFTVERVAPTFLRAIERAVAKHVEQNHTELPSTTTDPEHG